MKEKGFTLIELLIVIAIIAILSVTVVLTLNPVQMLRQARDSQRISDMATLKSAMALYLADVSSPSTGSINTCYVSVPSGGTAQVTLANCQARMASSNAALSSSTVPASTTGGGWIPVNLTTIGTGSPLGSLPADPINNATYYYSYATNGSPNFQYEIDAVMESDKYGAGGGTNDVGANDGGTSSTVYEVGTNLGL